jgi:hypothetical protein
MKRSLVTKSWSEIIREKCTKCLTHKVLKTVDEFQIDIQVWQSEENYYVKITCDKPLYDYEDSHPFRLLNHLCLSKDGTE